MNQRSFNKTVSIVTLIFFLGTPLGVFAQISYEAYEVQRLQAEVQSLQARPNQDTAIQAEIQRLQGRIQVLQQQIQNGNQRYSNGGTWAQNPNSQGGGGANGLGQALLLSSVLGGQGGAGAGGLNPAMLGLAMMGGGGGLGGGGGGGPLGSVSQALTMAGALSGNMGLLLAGMITSMIGGLAGGAGSTPQRGAVDEQYVAPGQAGPYGSGGYNPYYATPTPFAGATPVPSAACAKSIFIVKDTTVTPNVTKPYPTAIEIPQNQCVLAINSDSAQHSVQAKAQGSDAVITTQSILNQQSHIFRFPDKKTYTLCVDATSAACTTVTVK